MSKRKYLVFNKDKLPRVLINPSEETLSRHDPDQILEYSKNLNGIPLEQLVLSKGEARRATDKEQKEIAPLLKNRRVINQESFLKQYQEEIKKLKKLRVVVAVSVLLNIGLIVKILDVLDVK